MTTDGSGEKGQPELRWQIPPSVLLESVPSVWLVADARGRIVMVNSNVTRTLGYEPDELIGRPVEVLIPWRLREAHRGHRALYMRQPTRRPMGIDLRLQALRKDGSEVPVEISLSPIHTDDGVFILSIVRDISQRLALEEERNALKAELDRQQERERIGMDLHDGVMQEIYAVGLTLELALVELDAGTGAARQGVERAIEQLHDIIRSIRSYIFDLRPREFSGDLATALRDLIREFQQNSQLPAAARIEADLSALEMDQAVALYHIAHEALSNVQRHARATAVSLTVKREGNAFCLVINDDGVGFDPAEGKPERHRGLRNMASRARSIGAVFDVQSRPGEGAQVKVTLPLLVGADRLRGQERQAS